MKILWLCNITPPAVSAALGEAPNPFGGWISGMLDSLSGLDEIKITVCFPRGGDDRLLTGETKGIGYCGYCEKPDSTETFREIIRRVSPDVIHIWGTEYKHTLDMVNAAESLGLLDKVAINIQGLVSVYGKYHYYAGLPESVCGPISLKEHLHKCSIADQKTEMENRGAFEIEALKKVRHVIGRTEWDEACARQINPSVAYHHNYESLRETFYHHTWNVDKCRPHSIFVSQSNYPIKGFHKMLEAMPFILAEYPDAHLFTTGTKPARPETLKRKLAQRSYPKYIRELMEQYSLEDHITFLGLLNEQEMCEQYLKANVFVSPSSIENSSNSIGEALLLGMPVVSSDVGGVKDFIRHGENGYLYPFDAPYMLAYYVCRVFENREKAAETGCLAGKTARSYYDRESNCRMLLSIYHDIAVCEKR